MIFKAFIDDSADRKREKVIVAGAVIGHDKTWRELEKRWNQRLAKDGLAYFKSSHCETLNGQFHKFRGIPDRKEARDKADKVREDLDRIIRGLPLTTLGVVLSVPFYEKMHANQKYWGPIPDIPYQLAFQQMLAECALSMQALGRNNIVEFGHDQGDDYPQLLEVFKAFRKKNDNLGKHMLNFAPMDDKLHPESQSADVAAWVTFKFALKALDDPSTQNIERLEDSMYKIVRWMDPPHSTGLTKLNKYQRPAKCEYVLVPGTKIVAI